MTRCWVPHKRAISKVATVTYDDGRSLTVAVKYDQNRQMQKVYLNGKLKSSLKRAPLAAGIHAFEAPANDATEPPERFAYQVWMAYDTFSDRLRYDIRRSVVGAPSHLKMCLQCNIDSFEIDPWGLW